MGAYAVTVLHAVRELFDFLGAGQLVAGIILLLAAPYVDRWLIRRNQLTYQVVHDSKIAIVPDDLVDDDELWHGMSGQGSLPEVLSRMSVVVIDIRNTGGSAIHPGEFSEKLAFDFGPRRVWNLRVSEPPDEQTRRLTREQLVAYVPGQAAAAPGEPPGGLSAVRRRVGSNLRQHQDPAERAVRLGYVQLGRRERFKLVVVLVEPKAGYQGTVHRGVRVDGGALRDGTIRDAAERRRFTVRSVTGVAALVLGGLLLLRLALPSGNPDAPGADCVSGALAVQGSTVFTPTVRAIADAYQSACSGAAITTEPDGSVNGARAVAALTPDRAGSATAVTVGKQDAAALPGMRATQLAVVVYDVVVNSSAGLDGLTSDQLRGIYTGRYRDWNQLRGGPSLPIRVVGRGQSSGTRELFETRVLRGPEPALSSNDCQSADRDPAAVVIRCERDDNADVVRMISQTPGAIGYSDVASVAAARRSGAVTALTIDDKAFDSNVAAQVGYPFWTVEYLYTRADPAPGGLLASFTDYLRRSDTARARLAENGFVPCTRPDGAPLGLCNYH